MASTSAFRGELHLPGQGKRVCVCVCTRVCVQVCLCGRGKYVETVQPQTSSEKEPCQPPHPFTQAHEDVRALTLCSSEREKQASRNRLQTFQKSELLFQTSLSLLKGWMTTAANDTKNHVVNSRCTVEMFRIR